MGFPAKTPGSRPAREGDFSREGFHPQIDGQGIGGSRKGGKLHPLTGVESGFAGQLGSNHNAEHAGNGLIKAMHAHADKAHPVRRA